MSRPAMFTLPNIDELPAELKKEVLTRRSLNVYRMIMHSPAVAPSFLAMSDALRHETTLPGRWRELAVLRVGHLYGADYEVHHHERLARSVGLSESAIAATHHGVNTKALTSQEQLILRLSDQLVLEHSLTDESREKALAVMTINQLADLVLTVGYYQLVCNFLNTFGVTVES